MFAEYPVLCMVTGGALTDASSADEASRLLMRIAAAAQSGVTIIQIREPYLSTRRLSAFVRAAEGAVEGTAVHLVVNDRLDVAIATGVHGVHLKENSVPATRARAVRPPPFLIGRSIHRADAVAEEDVDYFVFGAVFDTPSKPGIKGAGVRELQAAAARSAVPVLAIGGISESHLPEVRAAGAAGFAAIRYFDVAPAHIAERCARAREIFDVPEHTLEPARASRRAHPLPRPGGEWS